MLKLYIVRHAKSSKDDFTIRDFDRPLNKRGLSDAPMMGARLREKNIMPDIMITSPAARASATCEAIAAELGFPKDRIKPDRRIYHAEPEQLLTVVAGIGREGNESKSVMIFGHNPGLSEFAGQLLSREIELPTCAVLAAKLNIEHWDDIGWGCADLEFFDFPKKAL